MMPLHYLLTLRIFCFDKQCFASVGIGQMDFVFLVKPDLIRGTPCKVKSEINRDSQGTP